jgi:ABC-type amino acid transport substrate-binding protein
MSQFMKALSVCALVLAGGVLGATGASAESTLERVIEEKTLVVGMSADQPPMNAKSREGKYLGLDVDLAAALARAMRVRLEIREIPFGDLMEALEEGEVDLVISGMAITPERALQASFVGPYMLSGKSILTRADVIEEFATGELASKDVRLAALKNSTSATFVREAAPKAELVEVNDYASAVTLIRDGKVAGLVADMPACALAILRYPDAELVTLDKPMTVEPIGVAVSADDPQFRDLVENYLEAYERTGLMALLRERWFENADWIAALP